MYIDEPGSTDESLESHTCIVRQTLHGKQVPTAICHLLGHLLAMQVAVLRGVRQRQCAVLLSTHLRSIHNRNP